MAVSVNKHDQFKPGDSQTGGNLLDVKVLSGVQFGEADVGMSCTAHQINHADEV